MHPDQKSTFGLKVYSNDGGSQRIDVSELEGSRRVLEAVARLYEGFVAEQQYRAMTRALSPGPHADPGIAPDTEDQAETSRRAGAGRRTESREAGESRKRAREEGQSDS